MVVLLSQSITWWNVAFFTIFFILPGAIVFAVQDGSTLLEHHFVVVGDVVGLRGQVVLADQVNCKSEINVKKLFIILPKTFLH